MTHLIPPSLVLSPVSRRPLVLPARTVQAAMALPVPPASYRGAIPFRGHSSRASVVIVTYNNLVCNKLCIASLLANTPYADYEAIVVDNASDDGTPAYLAEVARTHPHVRVVFNDRNRGFSPATNQGLAAASGDVLVLLNNDTITAPGWLDGLLRWLKDPEIGLVGPVTNRIGNEAQIVTGYDTYGEYLEFARSRAHTHRETSFDIRMLAMFCTAMRREVYDRVGPLDEQFEVGMLEDEDYAIRMRAAGYRVVCAEDVFVHHFGQATFGNLFASGEYQRLTEENRRRFEAKWGVRWEPYGRRSDPAYEALARRVRQTVEDVLPAGSHVIVASKGDPGLTEFHGRSGWHFPQREDGVYAGHHPSDSSSAIAQLNALRDLGAQYFVLPQTLFWWLDHYGALRNYLEKPGGTVMHDPDCCVIYALPAGDR